MPSHTHSKPLEEHTVPAEGITLQQNMENVYLSARNVRPKNRAIEAYTNRYEHQHRTPEPGKNNRHVRQFDFRAVLYVYWLVFLYVIA